MTKSNDTDRAVCGKCAFALSIMALLNSVVAVGQERTLKPPELKVLEKFVGTWDCEIVTKPAVWTPKDSRRKAVEVNEMAFDGWFLHGCSKTPDGKTVAVLMNTYDPARKKYHFWRFAGRGCEELEGQWDEATSTLTLTTDHGDKITTTAAFHVIDKDHREYAVVAKASDGSVYLDMRGTLTRRQ